MKTQHVLLAVFVIAAVALGAYLLRPKKKETWFSRDRIYGKANEILTDRYYKKGSEGVAKLEADVKYTYKYPGTGDYTGLMCRLPNNVGCTSYNNIAY
jgi:hypothetical protein